MKWFFSLFEIADTCFFIYLAQISNICIECSRDHKIKLVWATLLAMTLHDSIVKKSKQFFTAFDTTLGIPCGMQSLAHMFTGTSLIDWQRFLTMFKKCFRAPLKGP